MGIFNRFFQKSVSTVPNAPLHQTRQNSSQNNPPPNRPKTLSELEREMAAARRSPQPSPQQSPAQNFQPKSSKAAKQLTSFAHKLLGTMFLIGVPVGALWIVNLPFEPIRRPIAQHAPLLLLPSRISIDHHYRQAIATYEEAKQLIDNATSFQDILQGESKLNQTQTSLSRLPLRLTDWDDDRLYSGWYNWRYSYRSLMETRAQVGRLKARVFQEKNGWMAFESAEQELGEVKQRYKQSEGLTEKQQAIALWRGAINRLDQIPADTFAGKAAEKILAVEQQQLVDVAGVELENGQSVVHINAAKQFAMQAAILSQNAPHPVARWQEAKELWAEAIAQLNNVSASDPVGYTEAQKLLAQYKTNQGSIQTRMSMESEATDALESAKAQIPYLNYGDRPARISRVQGIIFDLQRVKQGTTSYDEAQQLLDSAQQRVLEWETSQ
jgi:hypothetical protein